MTKPRLPPEVLAQRCASGMLEADAAVAFVGMKLEHIAPGAAAMSLTLRPEMMNSHGTCHGGFIFALADSTFAYACNSHNDVAVAQSCTITYINPAQAGDHLTAIAREVARRGRSGVYDIEVTDQTGQQIALFRGHSRTIKGKHIADPV